MWGFDFVNMLLVQSEGFVWIPYSYDDCSEAEYTALWSNFWMCEAWLYQKTYSYITANKNWDTVESGDRGMHRRIVSDSTEYQLNVNIEQDISNYLLPQPRTGEICFCLNLDPWVSNHQDFP